MRAKISQKADLSTIIRFLADLNPRTGIVNNVNTALVDPDKGPKLLVLGCIWVTQGPCGLGACPGCVSVARGCCVGFKWHFSVKMARWSTPRVPFRGTRGVFWGAREVARKHKRTVLKLRARTWALRVPRIHLHAASHAKHSPLFSPEKGHFWRSPPVL